LVKTQLKGIHLSYISKNIKAHIHTTYKIREQLHINECSPADNEFCSVYTPHKYQQGQALTKCLKYNSSTSTVQKK